MSMISALKPPSPAAPPIVVIGAGVVGLTLAIALAQVGYAVTCIGPAGAAAHGRTVALLDGSVRLLDGLGLWAEAQPHAAPLAVMRIVDDTPSLFRGPPVSFVARELGLPAFGYNIENAVLVDLLEAAARGTQGLRRSTGLFASGRFGDAGASLVLQDGSSLDAALVVAADGARSAARQAAGIATRLHRYPQVALTAMLDHDSPHGDVSTEFHTRQGPFTLVPMVPDESAPHRSSLVWVMAPDEAERRAGLGVADLALEIEAQARHLLGAVRVRGAVGRFPIMRLEAEQLVAPGLVLAGEAAHALPPIGAQGLNLSLRDVSCLVEHLAAALRSGRSPADPLVLREYAARRRGDIALRGAAVDALNRSLLSGLLPVDLLRGAGLAMLGASRPLRRLVMRQGLSPEAGATPGA